MLQVRKLSLKSSQLIETVSTSVEVITAIPPERFKNKNKEHFIGTSADLQCQGFFAEESQRCNNTQKSCD